MRKKFTFLALSACLLMMSVNTHAQTDLALSLNGTDYVSGPASAIPAAGGPYTVEFWAYIPPGGIDHQFHQFVFQGGDTTGTGAFYIGYDSIGRFMLGDQWMDPNFDSTLPSNVKMPAGQWTHIAFTFNDQDFLTRLYINGAEVDSNFTGSSANIGNFVLGALHDGAQKLVGNIDEFRIWDIARTGDQLKSNMFNFSDQANSDLFVYYKMDDNSTTISNIATGTGLPAVDWNGILVDTNLTTTPNAWVNSPVVSNSNALTFDGVNTTVTIPGAAQYDLDSGTVEFWVNPSSLSATQNSTILGNRGIDGGVRYSFHLSANTIGVDNGSGTLATIPYAVPLNTWTHLAFVNDKTKTTVYVNGIVQTNTIPGGWSDGFSSPSSEPITLGAALSPTTGQSEVPFTGSIDEVRIWNRQQTANQILNNYGVTVTGTSSSLVGQFSFDQGNAGQDNTGMTAALDASNNNNTGTLTGFALTGTASNFAAHTLASQPLPLTLTQFNVTRSNDEALLSWETQEEQNTSSFIIERSADGTSYTTIGSLPAAGNSNTPRDYAFTDISPLKNKNFYRLRQTDLDGKFTYSPVRELTFSTDNNLIWYSTGLHSVEIYLQQGSSELYSITDVSGRTLRKGQLNGGKTDMTTYPTGIYFVNVMTLQGQVLTTKVLIP